MQRELEFSAPYVSGSMTSREAAKLIEPELNALQVKVLNQIILTGATGATDAEMQIALGMNPSTQRPRRIELWRAGFLFDSGEQRKTESGRNAVVWKHVKYRLTTQATPVN